MGCTLLANTAPNQREHSASCLEVHRRRPLVRTRIWRRCSISYLVATVHDRLLLAIICSIRPWAPFIWPNLLPIVRRRASISCMQLNSFRAGTSLCIPPLSGKCVHVDGIVSSKKQVNGTSTAIFIKQDKRPRRTMRGYELEVVFFYVHTTTTELSCTQQSAPRGKSAVEGQTPIGPQIVFFSDVHQTTLSEVTGNVVSICPEVVITEPTGSADHY